jgi:asparagine synthase (glutamine-hydrolysing)
MCGIGGTAGLALDRSALESVADAMFHRGPDGNGSYVDPSGRASFAFRRLAIVDLVGGVQPMQSEDGRVHVVFNGEIYDHGALRVELESAGHRFRSDHSDTEVLVHGWEEWGPELFPRLNGMFATAVWDAREQHLVLARDRFGIKPLYYSALPDGGLVFASEIKALYRSGLVRPAPSAEGIREYFAFQNVWGRQTMFRDVSQLLPGELLEWQNGSISRRSFWTLSFPRSRRDPVSTLAEEHREILRRVVRRQIAADVPVMSYLSGGIDSTAITVAAHEVDPRVTAYSCLFDLDGVGEDRQVDEREFSRLVADTYDLRRVEEVVGPETLPETIRQYVRALEDLRMGMGYPVYAIAERVARDARVVLSGTGGDEFHGGYVGRYQALGLTGLRPPLGVRIRDVLGRIRNGAGRSSPDAVYGRILNFLVPEEQSATAFTDGFLRETSGFDARDVVSDALARCPSNDWRDRVTYVDATTYLHGLLVLEDKVSMAHSLETRVPLLDNELVDFMLDVPFDALYENDTGKVLFRESVRPWVPAAIADKPKMGFGPPDASWYRGPLRAWIEEQLSAERIRAGGVFRPEFVMQALDDHVSGRRDTTYLLWSLINFDAWCEEWGFAGFA